MIRCPSCGEGNPPGFRLCGYCGTELAPSTPARETRKTVTILFTDVTGSTALGERLDPESLRAVMARYFASMREVIERHGGTVEKYIGDAVMAVFGVPLIHEEDALRAVRAAAEMREALEQLNAGLRQERGVTLEARTGINTGSVVVGIGGAGAAIVVGDAVNVAARLQTAAAPGQILVGRATYELVRDAVEVGPAESLELKGKAEPVVAYRLSTVAPEAEGHRRRLDAPMVERDRELEGLRRAYERASTDRSSQLFTILGAAGVGKSRLVAEFLAGVRDDARVLRGRCLPYGEGITYLPVAEIIRQAAGIGETETADVERQRIDALVAGLPEAAAIARGLAGLIGLDVSAAPEELVWAFRRMLEHLADEKPLVILIDDIHWAEPTLLDLIESVADLTRDSPILFLCPARPEFLDDRPTWGGGRLNATTILLEPLSEGSALRLIDALLPGAGLPEAVRARIAEGAEGNPLYVEEFVGMLIDDAALVAKGDGWTASAGLESVNVPPTIQALLSARLDRLGADERAAAERASIVGRVFEQPAVVAISPPASRAAIPRHLAALVRKELIRADRSGLSPWETFRFRHMLIRDAAYESLPKSARAELHELFADWLDETLGDRRLEVEEIIGYHLEQAFRYRAELAPIDAKGRDLAKRAAQALIAAGGRALERSDIGAAVNLYGRAAALLEPTDPARLAILPDLGRALDLNGRFDDAAAIFKEAVEYAEEAGDEEALAYARVARDLTNIPLNASADELRLVADQCAATFERTGHQRGLSLAWRLRGEASWKEGSAGGDELAQARALEFARLAGSHWEETSIVMAIAIDLYWGPRPVAEAISWCEGMLANSLADRAMELGLAHALAHMQARLGKFELARSLAARSIEIAAESGQRTDAAVLNEVAADVETLAGNHEAAERLLADACDWFIAMGKPQRVLEALHALAQVDRGQRVDTERLSGMLAGTDRMHAALLQMAMAAAELAGGRLAEAERNARSAVGYFETTDFLTFHAKSLLVLGDVLRAAGQPSAAGESFLQALDLYRRKGNLIGIAIAEARLDPH